MTGEKLLANMELAHWSVHPEGGIGKKKCKGRIVIFAHCKFHFLKNMKIWCMIQVIIYPLLNLTYLKSSFNNLYFKKFFVLAFKLNSYITDNIIKKEF